MQMLQADPGLGKKLKQAAYKIKRNIKQAKSQRNIKRIMKEKGSQTIGEAMKGDSKNKQLQKNDTKFIRDVEKEKKRDTRRRKVKSTLRNIGENIKETFEDIGGGIKAVRDRRRAIQDASGPTSRNKSVGVCTSPGKCQN
jgi:small-conductance mechanosensitive channel